MIKSTKQLNNTKSKLDGLKARLKEIEQSTDFDNKIRDMYTNGYVVMIKQLEDDIKEYERDCK